MSETKIAVFPGTFDPITYGHLDVIRRGSKLFDRLIVGVSLNTGKKNALLSSEERMQLIEDLVKDLPNVSVQVFSGMTVNFVKECGTNILLRGIRTFADFEYEFQLAIANRRIGAVETVFVMAGAENSFVRSTLIKEAIALGGDVSSFVPPNVVEALKRHVPTKPEQAVGLGGEETPPQGKKGSGLRGEGIE